MGQPGVIGVVVDPTADGTVDEAAKILRSHPLIPFFAYVPLTPAGLRSVFHLSKHGLEDAFICGAADVDRKWQKAIEIVSGGRLAFALLRAMETRIAQLPFQLNRTLIDIFERPHRYDCVTDIARHAGISVRSLYRNFERTGLGSPRKMLTVAKLARGYSLLVSSASQLGRVCHTLSYSRPQLFSETVAEVFDCSPSNLRRDSNADEVVLHLLEWLYKPARYHEA